MLYALFVPWTVITGIVYGVYLHVFLLLAIPIVVIRRIFLSVQESFGNWKYPALIMSVMVFPVFSLVYLLERVLCCSIIQVRFSAINQDVVSVFRKTTLPMMSRRPDSRDVEVTLGVIFTIFFYYFLSWMVSYRDY